MSGVVYWLFWIVNIQDLETGDFDNLFFEIGFERFVIMIL